MINAAQKTEKRQLENSRAEIRIADGSNQNVFWPRRLANQGTLSQYHGMCTFLYYETITNRC